MEYITNFGRNSASGTSSFSDCEFSFAMSRLIKDPPKVAIPAYFVFGIVAHLAHERIWGQILGGNVPSQKTPLFWLKFLNDVFDGVHGPEGESFSPREIRWLTPKEKATLSESQILEKIEEKKKGYFGSMFLSVKAIMLDAIERNKLGRRVQIEYDFRQQNINILSPAGNVVYSMSGRIDRLEFDPDGQYWIFDLKSGRFLNLQRNRLVRDIQMTLYQFVCEKIFGRQPSGIFLQPISISKADLERDGTSVLIKKLEPVEIRKDPVHFQNLASLIHDVNQVIEMIIHRGRFSQEQIENWQPLSDWGKMADFARNVVEGRFIPRIGNWCDHCPWLVQCQGINFCDWARFENSLSPDKNRAEQISPLKKAASTEPGNLLLFEIKGKRSFYLAKGPRQMRNDLIALGCRKPEKITVILKQILKLLPPDCPCRQSNLIPFEFLPLVRPFLGSQITPRDLNRACPYSKCPVKKDCFGPYPA